MSKHARSLLLCLTAGLVLAPAACADAYWHSAGAGAGSATTATMPAGNQPSASVSGQSITVSWPQSSFGGAPLGTYGGGGYMLTRYANAGTTPITPNASCATTISGTGATLQCVESGVPYGAWQYAVAPVLNSFTGAQSPKSAATTVVTAAPALATATAKNPTAAQTTGDIELTWATVAGATGYNVYRRASGGSYDFGAPRNGATPVTATTYGDAGAGLAPATTYDYVVRAVAGSPAVESVSSNSLSAATISRPAAPSGVTATAAAAARVNVAWAGVSGAVGYNVYRTSTGVYDYASPLNGATLAATPAYADLTAVDAVTYRYVVRSVILGAGGARVESASSVESGAVVADGTARRQRRPRRPSRTGRCSRPLFAASWPGRASSTTPARAAVTVSAGLTAPEVGATVVFAATTPSSTAVIGSAAATSMTSATLNLTSLVDGVLTLTAYSRDAAGNVSAATPMTAPVRKDVTFSPALTATYHNGILGLGATIDGNAECGATVVATKNGNAKPSVTAGSGGDYEINVGSLLGSGGWTVTATDPAGNAAVPDSA